jgi:hypothetical protein
VLKSRVEVSPLKIQVINKGHQASYFGTLPDGLCKQLKFIKEYCATVRRDFHGKSVCIGNDFARSNKTW